MWAFTISQPRRSGKRSSWADALVSLPPFAHAEDFWAIFDRLADPSALASGCDYFLFREGFKPSWEAWPTGGLWQLSLPHRQPARGGPALDHLWRGAALAAIGEQLTGDEGPAEEICGVTVSVRAGGDRIAVWTRSGSDEPLQRRIGTRLLALLSEAIGLATLPVDMIYIAHADSRVSKKDVPVVPRYSIDRSTQSSGSEVRSTQDQR